MNEQALKERLQSIAKAKNMRFNFCWKQLLFERFLARLSCSSLADKFIFKGGLLLAYLIKIGRETADLDFSLTKIQANEPEIRNVFEQIINAPVDDGFSFSYQRQSLLIQPHMDYAGYRVSLQAQFGKMRDRIHIDIGIGDLVKPQSYCIPLVRYRNQPVFEDEITLLVYPTETIFAEKFETVISKGVANSRMKDYHDLFMLTREDWILNAQKLRESIDTTFIRRGTKFQFIQFDDSSLRKLQKLWTAHLAGLGVNSQILALPKEINTIIETVNQKLSTFLRPSSTYGDAD